MWKNERFTVSGREVIVMLAIFYIQIGNDYVYKSTAADSWYCCLEVGKAPKTEFLRWRRSIDLSNEKPITWKGMFQKSIKWNNPFQKTINCNVWE